MDIISALSLIAVIIPAVSYGWGMRGTTIGGEKGAMLPGALIGAIIALTSGILIVQEYFYVFAALGAIGMYFGGCMTYGETLGLSMNAKPAENMKKGLTALFIKGFLWFGTFGAILTTGINAISGVYSVLELIVIFIMTPALSLVCYHYINHPLDIDQHIFPKIYFSKTRKEYWGAMVGLMGALLIINIIKLNGYVVIFSLICGVSGGIGWVIAQLLQIGIKHYSTKSKYVFIRKISTQNKIDSWKAMECTLGSIGALGVAIAHIVTYNSFKNTVFSLEINGGVLPKNNILSLILFIIWLVLLVADMAHYFVKRPVTKSELLRQLRQRKITKEEYGIRAVNAVEAVPKFYDYYEKSTEAVEFILYAAIPFVLICLGCIKVASVMSLFIIFWVLAQEIAFEKKFSAKVSIVLQIIFCIIGLIIFIYQVIVGFEIDKTFVLLLYTAVYEVLTLGYLLPDVISKTKNKANIMADSGNKLVGYFKCFFSNKGLIITHVYFTFCVVYVLLKLI